MIYGARIKKDNSIAYRYLEFDSGKRIELTPDECKEFEGRLRLERATGKLIERESNRINNKNEAIIEKG